MNLACDHIHFDHRKHGLKPKLQLFLDRTDFRPWTQDWKKMLRSQRRPIDRAWSAGAEEDEDIDRQYNEMLLRRLEWTLKPWRSDQKSHPDHAALFGSTNADGSSSKSLENAAERWLPLPTVNLVLSKSLPSQLSPNATRLSSCYTPLPQHSTHPYLQRDALSFDSIVNTGYSSANNPQ
jgi:hypothetical protein